MSNSQQHIFWVAALLPLAYALYGWMAKKIMQKITNKKLRKILLWGTDPDNPEFYGLLKDQPKWVGWNEKKKEYPIVESSSPDSRQ